MNRTPRLLALLTGLTLLVTLTGGCGEEAASPAPPAANNGGGAEDAGMDAAPVEEDAAPDAAPDASDTSDNDAASDNDADPPDAAEEEDVAPDAADDPCARFAVEEPNPAVTVLHTFEVRTQGGSGDVRYRWAPEGNQSGGILDELAGLYLAGPQGGVTDTLAVIDEGCALTQTVTVDVISPLVVSPPTPEIGPERELCFEVVGGSGELSWSLVQKGSGASSAVDAQGCYTSGAVQGEDVVQALDLRTGQVFEARVQVLQRPLVLKPTTAEAMVAAGDRFQIAISGGSGVYDFAAMGGAVAVEPQADDPDRTIVVEGQTPGTTRVQVQDRFYPELTTEVVVHAMQSAYNPTTLWGIHSDDNDIVDLGDVTGDGLPDLMLGLRSGSLNGIYAGAAMLYVGVPGGIAVSPTQIISGSYRYEYLGRSLAVADFNQDGCNDVAVSVWGSDNGGGDRGEVHLYTGCNTTPVEDAPLYPMLDDNWPPFPLAPPLVFSQKWQGAASGDYFGYAVEAGDFNGDGLPDLAVSAPRFNVGSISDAGRVSIYLNRAGGGLPDEADLNIEGQVFNGAAMDVTANLQLGFRMRAGDVNGDGCADLLVGSASGETNDGYASLYLSAQAPQNPSGCELSPQQAVAIAADPTDSRRDARLGWEVELGDLNGDCLPDLIVTALQAARLGGSNTAAGAVHVFFSDPAWSHEQPVRMTRGQANISLVGDDWDQLGSDVALGDVDGDGLRDLVVSSRYGEDAGTVADVGEVWLYRGRIDGTTCAGAPEGEPILEEPVKLINRAERYGDLFGNSLALVSDRTGDGLPELVIHNARGAAGDPSELDDHRGLLHWLPSEAPAWSIEHVRDLAIPSAVADELFGQSVEAIGDINGDGYQDFAAGAPYADRVQDQTTYRIPRPYAGSVLIYLGGPDGVSAEPSFTLGGHLHHTDYDYFGYDLTTGDVNGDGQVDLIVSALLEDATAGSACESCRNGTTTRSDNGAVYIYLGGPDFGEGVAPGGEVSTYDYVACAPQTNSINLGRKIQSGFDIDGDGRSDLAFSNSAWSSSRGRLWYASTASLSPASPTLCLSDAAHLVEGGPNTSDVVGRSLAAMDINGDGCEDLLSGADNYDFPGLGGAGTVTVLLGTGRAGCPAAVTRIDLRGERANENIGFGLAVLDADGDGVKDLAVASTGAGSSNLGAVFIYSGAALRVALANVQPDAVVTLGDAISRVTLWDPTGTTGTNFGVGIANVGDLDGDGDEELLVGAQLARLSPEHTERTGAAWLYHGSSSPLELEQPDAVLQGEARLRSDSRFGWDVAGAKVSDAGPGVLLVGAPFAERPGAIWGQLGTLFITHLDNP